MEQTLVLTNNPGLGSVENGQQAAIQIQPCCSQTDFAASSVEWKLVCAHSVYFRCV